MQLQAHSLGRKRMHDLSVTREHILFDYKIYLQFLLWRQWNKQIWSWKIQPLRMKKFNNLILQGSFRLCKWLSLRRLVLWINHLPPACWSTFCKSIFKHQFGCRFDILESISSFFLYFDICDHICLDTSYHFLALPLFLKYSLFFQVLMYKHLP